jgi:hypothetical protein
MSMASRASGKVLGINWKAPMEGHRILGSLMRGDGTSTEHKRGMTEKGVDYATSIINITLQHVQCSMTYGAYYMPSLAYGNDVHLT